MAKTRTSKRTTGGKAKNKDILRRNNAPVSTASSKAQRLHIEKSIPDLLTEATTLLEQSQPEFAIPIVEEALRRLEEERNSKDSTAEKPDEITVPAVLVLAGETHVTLSNVLQAQNYFRRATALDPDAVIVSAEPWLWLAQLSDVGGTDSIQHYEKAIAILRREIGVLQPQAAQDTDIEILLDEKKLKLAEALCSMIEVYMTDLSWEQDAEARCETYIAEAVAVVPENQSASVLQCLANIRISQERFSDAKEALRRSLDVWKDDEESIPDFATRISLSRLLMEVSMLFEALVILEGLIREDDQSVEAWYLGGWCQLLQSANVEASVQQTATKEDARRWLQTCLKLYEEQRYEDARLKSHAAELLAGLDVALGPEPGQVHGQDNEEEDGEEWEDDDDDLDTGEDDDTSTDSEAPTDGPERSRQRGR